MPIVNKKILVSTIHEPDGGVNRTTSTPVTPSNINALLQTLKQSIQNSDAKTLTTLLSDDFIYPGDGRKSGLSFDTDFFPDIIEQPINTYQLHGDYEGIYRGNHHRIRDTFQYYNTRPIIETLFFEHNLLFRELVSLLAESKSAELHAAFVQCVEDQKKAQLPQELVKLVDQDTKDKLLQGLGEMWLHGNQLYARDIDKGAKVLDLYEKLWKNAGEFSNVLSDEKIPEHTKKIQSLHFKLTCVTNLYDKDASLGIHRECLGIGWDRLIANIAAMLFSGPILNLLNLAVTGNFFFFNQTRSERLINNVSQALETAHAYKP